MKRLFLMFISVLICGVMLTNCNSKSELKDDEMITLSDGSILHLENYQWLKKMIDMSKTDKTGNYWGCIWLEKFNGKEIFVTNMMLGSGGIMHWFFDCNGNHFISKNWKYDTCTACNYVGKRHVFFEDVFNNEEEVNFFGQNMKLDNLVYSSISIPCN